MWNMNDVTAIRYRHNFIYHVVFDDGTQGDIDFSGYISNGPVFAPLENAEFFRSAIIEGGTIAWPNCVDIAP